MPALPALPKAVCRQFESAQGHFVFSPDSKEVGGIFARCFIS